MMPRYIDAEALMQKLCKQCKVKDREYFCHAHCGDRMNIENMPTADVQPVKHGRWEHGECSVCGASPLDHVSGDMYVEVDYYPNYCPSCGSQNVDLWVGDESVPNEDMRPDNEVM